jgi:hypothetical protein
MGVATALLALGTPAMALGGLWCTIDDANLKMTVESGVTHGMGGPFFNFKASAELVDGGVAPDFRKLVLDDKLVHSWLEGGDTRLLFYTERDGDKPHGYLSITIKTLADPEDEEVDAIGTYELTYFEAERQKGEDTGYKSFKGEASCGGE